MKFLRKTALLIAATCLGIGAANADPVDLELGLVIDMSGSVSQSEFELQRDGYVAAFNDPGVQAAIQALGDAGTGGIAVAAFYFSTNTLDPNGLQIGWTQLQTAADAAAFATTLMGLSNTDGSGGTGWTNPAAGINAAQLSMLDNAFEGERLTIDVSGDGPQNCLTLSGSNPDTSSSCSNSNADTVAANDFVQSYRDAAAAAGITINGLAIEGSFGGSLTDWYENNVQTAGGFTVTADGFDNFRQAAIDKIEREILETQVSEPGTLALFGLGLVGLGLSRRRRTR